MVISVRKRASRAPSYVPGNLGWRRAGVCAHMADDKQQAVLDSIGKRLEGAMHTHAPFRGVKKGPARKPYRLSQGPSQSG